MTGPSPGHARSQRTSYTVSRTLPTTVVPSVGRPLYEPQFSPDGRQLYLGGYDMSGGLSEVQTESGFLTVLSAVDDTVWTVPVGTWPSRVTFGPDGSRAYVTSDRGENGTRLTVIDRSDGTSTDVEISPYVYEVSYSPDGRFGYAIGADEVTFIDLGDGATSRIAVSSPSAIHFSADGRHAYVVNATDGTAMVIEFDELPQSSTLA